MKKLVSLLLIVCSIFALVACGSKDGYEGTYECTYLSSNGTSLSVSQTYEYYTITLDGKGAMNAKFKLKSAPYSSGDSNSRYKVEGEKFIETVSGVKSEYHIKDGVITLEQTVQNQTIIVKFTLTVSEEV